MSIHYEEGTYWTLELWCDVEDCEEYFCGHPEYSGHHSFPDEETMDKAAVAEGWTLDKKKNEALCPKHSNNPNTWIQKTLEEIEDG